MFNMAPQVRPSILLRADFPIYAIKALDSSRFLIAGGGGQSKTGVPNAFEIYELKYDVDPMACTSIHRFDTGTDAIMNCSLTYCGNNYILACSQEDRCHLYSLKYKVTYASEHEPGINGAPNVYLKNRNIRATSFAACDDRTTNSKKKQMCFEVQCVKSVQTTCDNSSSSDSSFQKTVGISKCNTRIATGSSDGCLRIWKFPDMKMVSETQAHRSEIDDIEFSPDGGKVVSVSRDNTGSVWKTADGAKVCNLVSKNASTLKYRYRCCRYGAVEKPKDKFNLYTVSVPSQRSGKRPGQCFIASWDADSFKVKKQANTDTDILSALTVRDDGTYLAVGSISGNISVYISFSLQRMYHIKAAHQIFVTDLAFLPMSAAARSLVDGKEFSLLSVSVDRSVRLHQSPIRGTINIAWIILGCLILIYFLFKLMSDLGI